MAKYLYKIISMENWVASQGKPNLHLSADDTKFIHFALEDELDRIIAKYWPNAPEFIVLKIDSSQLPGRLVYESNQGGVNKYYHLYDGSIPLSTIIEKKIHKKF